MLVRTKGLRHVAAWGNEGMNDDGGMGGGEMTKTRRHKNGIAHQNTRE